MFLTLAVESAGDGRLGSDYSVGTSITDQESLTMQLATSVEPNHQKRDVHHDELAIILSRKRRDADRDHLGKDMAEDSIESAA